MEEISNIPKNTERTKTAMNKKILNNSMEELDYLNFSEIDLDIYNKNSSFGEDIFNPKYYCLNKEENKLSKIGTIWQIPLLIQLKQNF